MSRKYQWKAPPELPPYYLCRVLWPDDDAQFNKRIIIRESDGEIVWERNSEMHRWMAHDEEVAQEQLRYFLNLGRDAPKERRAA